LKEFKQDSNECTMTYKGHTRSVLFFRFGPYNKILYSCSNDKTMRSFDIKSGVCTRIFDGNKGPV